jgi:hypothetical protein
MSRHLLLPLALLVIPVGVGATIPAERFKTLEVGGMRLGMTPANVEAMIRARTDLGEPQARLGSNYDCDQLRPGQPRGYDPDRAPTPPEGYAFRDASERVYNIGFVTAPTGPVAQSLRYMLWRTDGDWASYLAEIEARHGKADFLGKGHSGEMVARWCEPGARRCDRDRSDRSSLALTWYPHSRWQILAGDGLAYELTEGGDVRDEREDGYVALAEHDPAAAKRLYARCTSPAGKFADERALDRHLVSIMPNIARAGPPVWDPFQVPAGVFAALRIDPQATFGKGICFNSSDVYFVPDGCRGVTSIGFRWARRSGDLWVVSLRIGGVALRMMYAALRKSPDGSYRRIWWNDSIAPFAKWRADGAVPMPEPMR